MDLMIIIPVIMLILGICSVIIFLIIDRMVTNYRLAESQREWNEYSKGMTRSEKIETFLEWLEHNKAIHGWKYLYIPDIWGGEEE